MSVLNYSKWDNLGDDDDDDDDGPRKPRVTRLDGPSTITIGATRPPPASTSAAAPPPALPAPKKNAPPPPRSSLEASYSKWDQLDGSDDDDDDSDSLDAGRDEADFEDPLDDEEQMRLREVLNSSSAAASSSGQDGKSLAAATPIASASPTTSGPSAPPGSVASAFDQLRAKLSRNGAERERHLWRQTESEVEVSVLLPPGTRARDLRPELRPADLLGGTRQAVVVHLRGGAAPPGVVAQPLFCETLAYPVSQPETAEELAWEVSDYEPSGGRRALRLTLQKENPHGVILWWERAIEGEAACDTTAFPDRRRAGAAQQQQDVWSEAQQMFRDKVAAYPPPQMIDVGDDGHGGGGGDGSG